MNDVLIPERPLDAHVPEVDPDTAHIEAAHLLAEEAGPELLADGFTQDQGSWRGPRRSWCRTEADAWTASTTGSRSRSTPPPECGDQRRRPTPAVRYASTPSDRFRNSTSMFSMFSAARSSIGRWVIPESGIIAWRRPASISAFDIRSACVT